MKFYSRHSEYMAARKKKKATTARKTSSVKRAKTAQPYPHHLFVIALASGVIIASYFIFTNFFSRENMSPRTYLSSESLPIEHMDQHTIQLSEQNASGEMGTATLVEKDGKVVVTLSVNNAPSTAQPAHIHVGTCADIGAVKYPLTNVMNGMSETIIDTTLANLMSQGELAINVHKSTAALNLYVACGDLVW